MHGREVKGSHIDTADLESYLRGAVEDSGKSQVESHLSVCPLCRVELRLLERFENIENDEELIAESRWEYAAERLEGWYKEWVREKGSSKRERGRERGSLLLYFERLMAPLAAALMLILIFVGMEKAPMGRMGAEKGVMRGSEGISRVKPVSPIGELEKLPDRFTWRADGTIDSFEVEIFDSHLETVFRVGGISGVSLDVTDSLRAVIRPGTVYLWKVAGSRGGEPVAVSGAAWFVLKPGR